MSKMNELNLLIKELKKCGESLVNIADELAEIFSETGEKKTEAPAESAKEYTFTEVRAFLAEKSIITEYHSIVIRPFHIGKHGMRIVLPEEI